jgi:hypothetical protein
MMDLTLAIIQAEKKIESLKKSLSELSETSTKPSYYSFFGSELMPRNSGRYPWKQELETELAFYQTVLTALKDRQERYTPAGVSPASHDEWVGNVIIDFVKEKLRYLDEQAEKSRTAMRGTGCNDAALRAYKSIVAEQNRYVDVLYMLVEDDDAYYSDEDLWERYIAYLQDWIESHSSSVNLGMTPASYDEWLDQEGLEDI